MNATATSDIDVNDSSLAGARAWFAAKGLTRPREGRVVAGVAAGFARRYDVNPLVARIIAVGSVVVLTPFIYIAAWILMPNDNAAA
jgi:phage shock protein PspC (stress-responsive transcriptional regulator)